MYGVACCWAYPVCLVVEVAQSKTQNKVCEGKLRALRVKVCTWRQHVARAEPTAAVLTLHEGPSVFSRSDPYVVAVQLVCMNQSIP